MTALVKYIEFRESCGKYHNDETVGHYSRDDAEAITKATQRFEVWQQEARRYIVSANTHYVYQEPKESSSLSTGTKPPDFVITVFYRE